MMPLMAGWYWVEEEDGVVVEEDCMVGNEERGYVKSGKDREEIVGWVGGQVAFIWGECWGGWASFIAI